MPTPSSIKFGAFSIAGCTPFAGILLDDRNVVAVEALRDTCRALDLPLSGTATLGALVEDWDRNLRSIRAAVEHGIAREQLVPVDRLHRHAPLPNPRQVLCVGANYRRHVIDLIMAQGAGSETSDGDTVEKRREVAVRMMDERAANGVPYAWVKSSASIAGPDDILTIPAYTEQPDWELELAVVIGKSAFQVPQGAALDHVAGYMIVNDLTARDRIYRPDLKAIGTDWLVGKSAPGFLPMGPYLVPRQDVPDPHALQISLKLNGEVMQDESTSDMIFGIARQIEYVSAHIRLMPGDVLCTGSPAGNGAHYGRFLRDGDVMEGAITGLGLQTTRCIAPSR